MKTTVRDPREQGGLELAARFKVLREEAGWLVPSQDRSGREYVVSPSRSGELQCSCPDYIFRAAKCKHIWAVVFVREREKDA